MSLLSRSARYSGATAIHARKAVSQTAMLALIFVHLLLVLAETQKRHKAAHCSVAVIIFGCGEWAVMLKRAGIKQLGIGCLVASAYSASDSSAIPKLTSVLLHSHHCATMSTCLLLISI
jgi:hypothetical protein